MIVEVALARNLPNLSDGILGLGVGERIESEAIGLADQELPLRDRLTVGELQLLRREIPRAVHDPLIPNREARDLIGSLRLIVLRAHLDDIYLLCLHHPLRDLLVEAVLLSCCSQGPQQLLALSGELPLQVEEFLLLESLLLAEPLESLVGTS